MSKFLKYLFISVAILLLAIAGFYGYHLYEKTKNPRAGALEAIPNEAGLLIEVNHLKHTFQKFEQQGFWIDLQHIPVMSSFLSGLERMDSVLSDYPDVEEILRDQKMIIAFLVTDSSRFDPVFVLELPAAITSQRIESIIKKENGAKSITLQKKYGSAIISLANIKGINKLYCFSVYKGLLISSFNHDVLERAIDQLDTGSSINIETAFKKVEQTAGKKVDANLYLNYKNLGTIGKNILNPDLADLAKEFPYIAKWTEIDLIIKTDELLLNGYTIPSDTGFQILNWFKQEPQEIKLTQILPTDVAWMFHMGIEDFSTFNLSRNQSLNSKALNKLPSYQEKLYSWMGKEMAIVETMKSERFIVLHSHNTKIALQQLNELAKNSSFNSGKEVFVQDYNDYTIGRIYISDFPENMLGQMFSGVSDPFFMCIKDYIVLSNEVGILKKLIDGFYNKKTFNRDYNYQSFSDNISEKSNIYFYCNIRNTFNNLPSFFKGDIYNEIILNKRSLSNFEGMALQYSFINGMFYTNIYLKYKPVVEEEEKQGWVTKLESSIVSQAQLVRNHKTGRQNIILFDELNHIYLIDNHGTILFKNQLIEKATGKIYEIDYFKNGDNQYLFSSENYLHLIDINGNYIENFPVQFPLASTAPLAVFDYENTKDYRLLIALNDNMIYNFSSKGEIIEGWKKFKASQTVLSPVEHMLIDDKDYIFITDANGNMNITSRRGEGRIKIKKSFKRAAHSKIYRNLTNSKKGLFLTTNIKGEIVYISQKGKVSKTQFGDFSENHYFLYEDFNNDGDKDFIFLDGKRLIVYDRYKKIILEYSFENEIKNAPFYYTNGKGHAYVGILSVNPNEILIINEKGLVKSLDELEHVTGFAICNLNKKNEFNILFSDENSLNNYLIQD
jgi:hypothetical protein